MKKPSNYITSDAYRENEFIIIELKPRSKVVSFKLREDLVRKLDKLIMQYNLGNRSEVLRGIVNALIELLDGLGDCSIKELILGAKYIDMNNGIEKTSKISLKI